MARPLAELVLSDDERQTLDDLGEPAQEHAAARHPRPDRPGLRRGPGEQAGRRPAPRLLGHRRHLAAPVRRAPPGGAGRRAAARGPAQDHRRRRRAGRHPDAGDQAQGRHPLEHPRHGRGRRHVAVGRRPHLALVRPEAAPPRDVQALHRPVLRREGPRRRRPLPQPAGAGDRPVRRREEPGPGPGPHPAALADDAGAGRAADARLRPQRDHVAVRGAERRHRRGDRPVPPAGIGRRSSSGSWTRSTPACRASKGWRSTWCWTTTRRTRRRR